MKEIKQQCHNIQVNSGSFSHFGILFISDKRNKTRKTELDIIYEYLWVHADTINFAIVLTTFMWHLNHVHYSLYVSWWYLYLAEKLLGFVHGEQLSINALETWKPFSVLFVHEWINDSKENQEQEGEIRTKRWKIANKFKVNVNRKQ